MTYTKGFVFPNISHTGSSENLAVNEGSGQLSSMAKEESPYVFQTNGARVVVVGDLHGDLFATLEVLRNLGVMSWEMKKLDGLEQINYEWIGGTSWLVQTGDLVDRGPDSKEIIDLFMDLESLAAQQGGKVIVLRGNHEDMVLQGHDDYVHPTEVKRYGGSLQRRQELSENGRHGMWLRKNPFAVIVDDSLFVHAGLVPKYAEKGLEWINQGLANSDYESGPVWTRSFSPKQPRKWGSEPTHAMKRDYHHVCTMVNSTLNILGAERMIIGHNVVWSGRPWFLCNGRLISNDVGLSRYISGKTSAALEITSKQEGGNDGSVCLDEKGMPNEDRCVLAVKGKTEVRSIVHQLELGNQKAQENQQSEQ